jgi:hypothetical protein
VVKAPPIAEWALYEGIGKVLAFYQSRGARITRVGEES